MTGDPQADQETPWAAARGRIGTGLLSVLMPAHNLGSEIADNIRTVYHFLLAGRIPFEILVIDDGSRDETAAAIRRTERDLPEVRALILPRNAGKGAALRAGFERAQGDFIVFLDADLDLSVESLPAFFRVMAERDADVVIGSKRHPESRLDYPWYRRAASSAYYFMARLMFGLPIRDTQTGLKLFKRAALEWAFPRILVKRFAFDLELLSLTSYRGYRIAEAPVVLNFKSTLGCFRPATVRTILLDTLAVFYRLRVLKYYQAIPDTAIPSPPPQVTIVIPCSGADPGLDNVLAAIAAQTYSRYDVLVLPDDPARRQWPERTREIPTGAASPARKRARGLAASTGDLVAFLGPGARPRADWLERAVAHFSNPKVVAVGGPLSTDPRGSRASHLAGMLLANPLVTDGFRYRHMAERVRRVDDHPFANLVARTGALRAAVDEAGREWTAETEPALCRRLAGEAGRILLYEPRAEAFAPRPPLLRPFLRQAAAWGRGRGRSVRASGLEKRDLPYLIPAVMVLVLAAGLAMAAVSLFCRVLFRAAVFTYALVTLASCAPARRPDDWLRLWVALVLTHAVYGLSFLRGCLQGRRRNG